MLVSPYSSQDYLEALAEFGEVVRLPRSKAGLLVQPIPGTDLCDARGPYPLFGAENWEAISTDLEERKRDWVCFVGVADPLAAPSPEVLNVAFPDLCRPYKEHFIVELRGKYEGPYSEGHRRAVRRAQSRLEIARVEPCPVAQTDWWRLYEGLCREKVIEGMAAFSESSFAKQLEMPEMVVSQARREGRVVAMTLWLVSGMRAYYHLGASDAEGYTNRASFGLFDQALRDLAERGVEQVLLGSGAGVRVQENDGLARFKAGWANASRTAYLCGSILNEEAYGRLSLARERDFFPAYRAPSGMATATT